MQITTSARLPFTGFRVVKSLDDCKIDNVTYYVDGKFYRGKKEVPISTIQTQELVQMLLMLYSNVLAEKPTSPAFGDTYKDGDAYFRYNGMNWQSIPATFFETFLNKSATVGRDTEAEPLVVSSDNTKVVSTNDLFIRQGVWNPAKNEPPLADGDSYPNFSVFMVSCAAERVVHATIVSTTIVQQQKIHLCTRSILPAAVTKEGVHNMDFVVKVGDTWQVVHNTKLVSAAEVAYGNLTVKDALDKMSSRIDDNHEVRFGTFRGYTEDESVSLENGEYVINSTNGQVYYNQNGVLMTTASGFVPNFNGRFGSVKPVAGDYDSSQITHGTGTLDQALAQMDKTRHVTMVSAASSDPPVSPVSGDLCFVVEKVVTETWGTSGFVTLNPGDVMVYTDTWVHVPSSTAVSTGMQLKMGGLYSENHENAAEGSVLVVDHDDLEWPKNTLLIKTGADSYIKAFPEVVTAESVTVASTKLSSTTVATALDELSDLVSSINKNVGTLYFTTEIPPEVAYQYQAHDYGYVDKFVSSGYIYNGSGYSKMTNVQPGTVLMLSKSNAWVTLWCPPMMIQTVTTEEELADVAWAGPSSYVLFLADTKNYKYGDMVTQSGSCLDDSADSMFNTGAFFDSSSVRMCLRQLDYALEFYLFTPKRKIGELTTEGWGNDLVELSAGDYLVCTSAGKVATTSSVLPNTMLTENAMALYDGNQWHLIGPTSTTDGVTHNGEILSTYLDRVAAKTVVKIEQFVDLTKEADRTLISEAEDGHVFKVAYASPDLPDIEVGSYVNSALEVVLGPVDLANTPCYFDPKCLSMEEYLGQFRTKVVTLAAGTHTDVSGSRRAWSNGDLVIKYNDDGSIKSLASNDKIFVEVLV